MAGSKDGDRTRLLPKCMRTAHGVPTICALALWFGAVWIAEEDSHNLHGPNGGHGLQATSFLEITIITYTRSEVLLSPYP